MVGESGVIMGIEIIVPIAVKGGIGKSTITSAVATEIHRKEADALAFIDNDRQASLSYQFIDTIHGWEDPEDRPFVKRLRYEPSIAEGKERLAERIRNEGFIDINDPSDDKGEGEFFGSTLLYAPTELFCEDGPFDVERFQEYYRETVAAEVAKGKRYFFLDSRPKLGIRQTILPMSSLDEMVDRYTVFTISRAVQHEIDAAEECFLDMQALLFKEGVDPRKVQQIRVINLDLVQNVYASEQYKFLVKEKDELKEEALNSVQTLVGKIDAALSLLYTKDSFDSEMSIFSEIGWREKINIEDCRKAINEKKYEDAIKKMRDLLGSRPDSQDAQKLLQRFFRQVDLSQFAAILELSRAQELLQSEVPTPERYCEELPTAPEMGLGPDNYNRYQELPEGAITLPYMPGTDDQRFFLREHPLFEVNQHRTTSRKPGVYGLCQRIQDHVSASEMLANPFVSHFSELAHDHYMKGIKDIARRIRE